MSDSDSDSFEVEKPPERREPSRRGNAGNRMQRLIQEEEVEEAAEDKDFYQQGFWADEEEDDDFAGDADDEEARDSFDSDFGDSSESESEEDEDEEKAARKKSAPKKKSVYKDPKLAHKKGAAAGEGGEGDAAAAPKPKKRPRPDPVAAGGFAAPLERSRRGATEASTAAAAERRKSTDAAARQRAERLAAKTAKGVELRRLTQEEILAEAAQTEIINKASLERMLRMEEEKRRVTKTTRVLDGPRIRFCSRADGSGDSRKLVETVSFIETAVPKNIDDIAPPYPVATRCAVSGQPARYLDPQTGTPYATLEAFRMLRGRTGRRQQHSFGGGASGSAMPGPLPGED